MGNDTTNDTSTAIATIEGKPVQAAKPNRQQRRKASEYKPPTVKQAVAAAKALGYDKAIAAGRQGWALKAITTIHYCLPSTHSEAKAAALLLARHLTGSNSLDISATPKLHYASANGGIAANFRKAYNPRRFAERTGIAGSLVLCATHSSRYDKCTPACRVGVEVDGKYHLARANIIEGKAKVVA